MACSPTPAGLINKLGPFQLLGGLALSGAGLRWGRADSLTLSSLLILPGHVPLLGEHSRVLSACSYSLDWLVNRF